MIWAITGPPGVGKSTVVSKVVLRLKSAGIIVGGCTSAQRRRGGSRTGFEIRDLTDGKNAELASLDGKLGPKVGRYRVNLRALADVGAESLRGAAARSEVIIIDEVGPLELVSPEFRRGVKACVDSGKPILAVVHERLDDELLNELRSKASETYALTVENREEAAERLGDALLRAAGGPKS
ncbi:MAG: NTPase [Thaumarchaeota archaeon]|nr:NTPase [Nitrososphaerota archaeon]